MKNITLLFLLMTSIGCNTKKVTSVTDNNEYYPIENVDAKHKYADSENYIIHKDLAKTTSLKNKKYSIRKIQYSWGKKVETYYRIENENVFYYDTKSKSESMIMPKRPRVGFAWNNSDNSWKYEIIQLDAELETPFKKYTYLLVIKATQLTNRDKSKQKEYLNYYQKGIGKIASVVNGKLMTYKVK